MGRSVPHCPHTQSHTYPFVMAVSPREVNTLTNTPFFAYDEDVKKWTPMKVSYQTTPIGEDDSPSSLKILSLNSWFGTKARRGRAQAIADEIVRLQPDVACLQEADDILLDTFASHDQLRKDYVMTDDGSGQQTTQLNLNADYGNLILVKRARKVALRCYACPLVSEMGRYALVADLGGICVACVHLESLAEEKEMRARQLEQVAGARDLLEADVFIVAGDFNAMGDATELATIADKGFVDVWSKANGDKPGLTCDTAVNLMRLKESGGDQCAERADRVFMHATPVWSVVSCELFGTEPIADNEAACNAKASADVEGETNARVNLAAEAREQIFADPEFQAKNPWAKEQRIWLSDHFGLIAQFKRD